MKAISYEGPETIGVGDRPIPRVREGWVLIKVAYAGVCGSDMTIYQGKHPRARAPLVMGHEFSGTVASECGEYPPGTPVVVYPYLSCGECEPCKQDHRNVCRNLKLIGIDLDGGMAEYAAVPLETIVALPPETDLKLAAFTEPVAISVHAVRQSGYRAGDSVVIFGAGAIGMALALTLRTFGAGHILLIDPNHHRSALAESMGFDVVRPGQDIPEEIRRRTAGEGADYVFDCAGHQSVVDLLPDAVKINGTIVVVAGYKNPPHMDFQKGMFREFTLRFVRNCTRKDFQIAGEILGEKYGALLNCVLPPEKAGEGFSVPEGALKVMFAFEGGGKDDV